MKKIKLTQGKVAVVDEDDYDFLNQWKWCYNNGYAVSNARTSEGQRIRISMHRVIMKVPKGYETDHCDMNRLNNQKSNLRICTPEQNKRNRRKNINNKSGYKGVVLDRVYIYARIFKGGKHLHLGSYPDLISAAKAYDNAAIKYHGEFARLNFPTGEKNEQYRRA